MKHLKKRLTKHIKNISKATLKKTMSALVLLFFAMAMLFQKDASTAELQFVWNADEVFLHNAPNAQWDYLFEDEWGQEVYQGQMSTGSTVTPSTDTTDTLDSLINPDEIGTVIGEQTSWTIYTGVLATWTLMTGTQKTWMIFTGSLDCTTPRGEQVKNKDFVLAYRQRKDVNTICDIEKRVCTNWTLLWSFTQNSCKDEVSYEYQKAEVVSYNQKILNEYVQPVEMTAEEKKAYNELIQPKDPANIWAEFDTEGKIDGKETPIDTRWTTNSPVITQPEVGQTPTQTKKSCTAPRWQKIQHGQFIKAYKAPRGFIDLPCDVQIRACVNGVLKGNFKYATCTYNNTTYADYLTAGSPASNTGFLFFERIKKVLRRR